MLVLSRKSQEKIQIGDQITISVLAVKGNVVRIGIEAPNNIHIVRGELPPLDKSPSASEPRGTKSEEASAAASDATGARVPAAVAPVARPRVAMHRYPALQSRLNRRMDILKAELTSTT